MNEWDNETLAEKLKDNPDLQIHPDSIHKQATTSTRKALKFETGILPKPKLIKAHPERDFQQQIIDMAHLYGWRIAHFRPAMKKDGTWVTPVSADGKGFPDLLLVHPTKHKIIVVEVKTEKGKLTPEQERWLWAFAECDIQSYDWRPSDWDYIVKTLTV